VLLTPAAAVICRELMDGVEDGRWDAFRPGRFSPELSATAAVGAGKPHSSGTVTFDENEERA
jgi:glycine oxidase